VKLFIIISTMIIFSISLSSEIESLKIGPSVVVKFEHGQDTLSQETKNKLEKLIANAKVIGKIKEVQIAAWPDSIDSFSLRILNRSDRLLSNNRARSIRHYLQDRSGVTQFLMHNMLQRDSWLTRLFNTKRANERTVSINGFDGLMTESEAELLKNNAKESSAIIIIILDN
jgi:hypothetical protein